MLVTNKQLQILVRVYQSLLHICVYLHASTMIEFLCYDDACHLKRFARNPVRASLTTCVAQLASVEMAVDKMHIRGHTDPWCRANCDPSNFPALMKVVSYILDAAYIYMYILPVFLNYVQVDTEVCEQVFSWLSKYSYITRKMSQHTFVFSFVRM